MKEGFKVSDFYTVIEKKAEEWLNTDYAKHLCPDTLFGTKFEKYVNQKKSVKKQTRADIIMKRLQKTEEEIC